MPSFGQLIDVVLDTQAFCSCGELVRPGATVGVWRSGIGRSRDKIVSCDSCQKPNTILGERAWLMKQREKVRAVQGPTAEMVGALTQYDYALDANWRHANVVLLRLLERLPKCSECSRTATHMVRYGLFFCDLHAKEHSTAQKVDWYQELKELGVES